MNDLKNMQPPMISSYLIAMTYALIFAVLIFIAGWVTRGRLDSVDCQVMTGIMLESQTTTVYPSIKGLPCPE